MTHCQLCGVSNQRSGTPVVVLCACRNMWHAGWLKLKAKLDALGARVLDHIVLIDQGPTWATFITTPRWLWTGKKGGFWGLPAAGLNAQQIAASRRFGLALRDALAQDAERAPAPLLSGLNAVTVNPRLYASERAGTRSFFIWAHLLRWAGGPGSLQRLPLLALYVIFLVVAIISVVPLSLLLQAVLRPWLANGLGRIKTRFEMPSGSDKDRLPLYED